MSYFIDTFGSVAKSSDFQPPLNLEDARIYLQLITFSYQLKYRRIIGDDETCAKLSTAEIDTYRSKWIT